MFRIAIFILLMPIHNNLSAHQLPQQISSKVSSQNIVGDHMNFTIHEINHWNKYADTLDIAAIAEKVNMPILISYSSTTEVKSNPAIECSIYVDDSDKVSPFCGNLDDDTDFMKSALSAIGYCHFKEMELRSNNISSTEKLLVPYFKGPTAFVASMYEPTPGNHHTNYNKNQGLQFHCVEMSTTLDE